MLYVLTYPYFPAKGKTIPGAAHRTLEGLLQLLEQVAGAAAAPLNLLYRHKKTGSFYQQAKIVRKTLIPTVL
jgi:hypothetical protein